MMAPLRAPQVPRVRAIPLQNAVAILLTSSLSTPWAQANETATLSAQYIPRDMDCSADLRIPEGDKVLMVGYSVIEQVDDL